MNQSIYVQEEERGTRNKKCTVGMTVDMTSLVPSWGEFNVWGPANQQSRLTNDCGAGTKVSGWMPPCPPSLPLYSRAFPYNHRCVLILAGPDVIITRSVYLSVLPTCREKPFNYFWRSVTRWLLIQNDIYLSRQIRLIMTEPSEFVQVSCFCTGRWHYMDCFQFDHAANVIFRAPFGNNLVL